MPNATSKKIILGDDNFEQHLEKFMADYDSSKPFKTTTIDLPFVSNPSVIMSRAERRRLEKTYKKLSKVAAKKPITIEYTEKLSKKGMEGEVCCRSNCSTSPAVAYNHGTHRYYCASCAILLNEENADWAIREFGHNLCTYEGPDEFLKDAINTIHNHNKNN